MNSHPYTFRTVSGSDVGGSFCRKRAVEAARRIARTTGEVVFFAAPDGVWQLTPGSQRRVTWVEVTEAA